MPIARVRGPGHPDQVCDLVATTIVEEYARRDPAARLHIRVMGGHGAMFVTGEVASTADFDVSSVVRRVVGVNGGQTEMEPFIALEPMTPGWAAEHGAREGATVVSYATHETLERLPKQMALAQQIARLIEKKRLEDEDWFWLDADYEVLVERVGEKYVTVIRAGHTDTKPINEVRSSLQQLLSAANVPGPIRINPAGEETRVGLAYRVGSSGRLVSTDVLSSLLPSSSSGVGLHASHPLNMGAWLARAVAKECVGRELGQAIQVSVSWLPLESRPHQIRIHNERGDDLSQAVPVTRFDLRQAPEAYLKGEYLSQALQAQYSSVELPWEK